METSKMKNMVVLKNLPSNIVDEAIIVLKSNKKLKRLENIEKNRKISKVEEKYKDKEYILREAEMLVNDYIVKIEDKENKTNKNQINKKYKTLKKYSIITTIICAIQSFILLTI